MEDSFNHNKDSELMKVQPDEQFLKNYQAIYYAMNAKPDCKSKIYGRRVIIEMSDLQELNRKVTDKFKAHYEEAGFTINVTVSFTDHTSIEFNSWTTFQQYDWTEKRTINNITIKWEYNAKLPQYSLPQKHTLVVRLANEIKPEEMLNLVVTGKLEQMDQINQEICPIVARVDFINSILAEELLNIVSSWQEGLVSNDKEIPKIVQAAKKFRRGIAYIINYVSILITLIFCYKFLQQMMSNVDAEVIGDMKVSVLQEIFLTICIFVIVVWIIDKIFSIVANVVFLALGNYKDHHTFNITKGDKIRCQEISDQLSKNKAKLIFNLALTLIFNVFCSIIANNLQIFF